jgi:hypothetical protein
LPINWAQSRLLDLGASRRSSATNPDTKPTFPYSTSLLRPTECRLPSRASEYYTKAFQLRDHASEREKLAITAMYYSYVVGDLDKAAQAYHESIESYPRIDSAYGNLGSVYGEQGQYGKATQVTSEAVRPLAGYGFLVREYRQLRPGLAAF